MPQAATDPTPDPIADVLRAIPGVSDEVRATAWDAFNESADADELTRRITPLPLPEEVKAALWDAKEGTRGLQLNFAVVNKEDQPIEGSPFERLTGNFWKVASPWAMLKGFHEAIKTPEATGRTIEHLYNAQKAQVGHAWEALQDVDWLHPNSAAGPTTATGLRALGETAAAALPVLGPAAREAGEQIGRGDVAGGIGTGLGMLVPFGYGEVLTRGATLAKRGVQAARTAAAGRPIAGAPAMTPEQIAWAEARGIPLSAGMVSDNPIVQGAEALADRTLGGADVALRDQVDRAAALRQVGGELRDEAHPDFVSPRQAGDATREQLLTNAQAMVEAQRAAYGPIEQRAAQPGAVQRVPSAPFGSQAYRQLFQRLQEGIGGRLTHDELYVMRQIEAELDAIRHQRGRYVDDAPGVSSEGHYARGQANAPVYREIREAAPGTAEMTGREMREAIARTLETGTWTNPSRGALQVARARLARVGGDVRRVGGPTLPEGAPVLGGVTEAAFPVRLDVVKRGLTAARDRLRQMQESASHSVMGAKADALAALERLIDGPDVVPLLLAEELLGDLKTAARADIPQFRTQSQGLFAHSVNLLQKAVDDAAAAAGPDVAAGLQRGRAATVAKVAIEDLVKRLQAGGSEGQKIHAQLTAPKDSGVNYLRQVAEVAPGEMPKIGRAYLEELLGRVVKTKHWGTKSAGMVNEWRKLGPETKQLLFPGEGQVQNLDHFFDVVERVGALQVNPSGSGYLAWMAGQAVAAWANPWTQVPVQITARQVAQLLHSPRAVKWLTAGLDLPPTATAATRGNLTMLLLDAAADAGVALPGLQKPGAKLPKAAEGAAPPADQQSQQTDPTWGTRADGSPKGAGFLGPLTRPDGAVSSELSIGVSFGGKDVEIPLLVPTLTADERTWLLTHDVEGHAQDVPQPIVDKAIDFARERQKQGKPYFAQPGEQTPPKPTARAAPIEFGDRQLPGPRPTGPGNFANLQRLPANLLEFGMDTFKGATGLGDQGPAGPTWLNAVALGAALPLGGLKGARTALTAERTAGQTVAATERAASLSTATSQRLPAFAAALREEAPSGLLTAAGRPVESVRGRSGLVTPAGVPIEEARHLAVAPAARSERGELTVSGRVPTAKGGAPAADPRTPLVSNLDVVKQSPAVMEKLAANLRKSPLLTQAEARLPTDQLLDTFVNRVKENLLRLWDDTPAHIREHARTWYEGAQARVIEDAKALGVTQEQSAALLAVLSPQKDWFQNAELARRLGYTWREFKEVNPRFTADLFNEYRLQQVKQARGTDAFKKMPAKDRHFLMEWQQLVLQEEGRLYVGKRYRDLPPDGQARMVRAFSETMHPTQYPMILPDGSVGPMVVNKPATSKGGLSPANPAKLGWGLPNAFIENAISVLENGSPANISRRLGLEHKVRAFFNNINDPWNPHFSTIDTHAVGAGHISPFAQSAAEVEYVMGGVGDAALGISGANPVYQEAYMRAARERGVLPREMQSVTWETVRGLFSPAQKRDTEFVKHIEGLWKAHNTGMMSLEQVYDQIKQAAGGIREPAWAAHVRARH